MNAESIARVSQLHESPPRCKRYNHQVREMAEVHVGSQEVIAQVGVDHCIANFKLWRDDGTEPRLCMTSTSSELGYKRHSHFGPLCRRPSIVDFLLIRTLR